VKCALAGLVQTLSSIVPDLADITGSGLDKSTQVSVSLRNWHRMQVDRKQRGIAFALPIANMERFVSLIAISSLSRLISLSLEGNHQAIMELLGIVALIGGVFMVGYMLFNRKQ
jgi:hypothetical protein